jgi:capsular exopolysaccharide synthesis family protein
MTRLRKKHAFRSSEDNGELADLSETLVTISDPTGAVSEAYRMLRTNLFYASVDAPPKVIVLTSPGTREGKSTTTANLGVTLAQAGKETLLLDCDLRRPMLHNFFGTRNLTGLAQILVGERTPQEAWHEPLPGLKLVTAGPPPLNPAELLGSQSFAEFVGRARQEFDYVVMDTPPVTVVSDSAIVATRADGALLVLDAQGTRKGSLRQAVHNLEGVGATVLGTVMNNVAVSRDEYTGYSYTHASR